MPGKCAEEDLVVYLAFTPIILLIYALRLIHRPDENSQYQFFFDFIEPRSTLIYLAFWLKTHNSCHKIAPK